MQKKGRYLMAMVGFMVTLGCFGRPAKAVERLTPTALMAMAGEAVILDARPKRAWEQGHIPYALSFSWEEYTKTDAQKIPYRTPPPDEMAQALGRLGITESTPIVITGDADTSWGGEGWIAWVLTWIGHQGPVFILEGGLAGWKDLGYTVETKSRPFAPSIHYTPHPDSSPFISVADLRKRPGDFTLIDTRSFIEWIMGHIPSAIHISWKEMVDTESRTPLDPKAMRALLTKKKISIKRPIVYYCTGGIRSGWSWMAHEMAELPPAINLEGGYEAWKRTGQ